MFRSLTVCALFALCACGSQRSSELDDFATAFREANRASDVQALLALYELEGSTSQTINFLKNALFHELGLPIQSIGFEPLSGAPEENIRFTHQGIEYRSTLEPQMRMRVSYDTPDGFESLFTIGQTSAGAWRIVSSRPVKTPDTIH